MPKFVTTNPFPPKKGLWKQCMDYNDRCMFYERSWNTKLILLK